MALAGGDQGDVVAVAEVDGFLIFFAAAGVDDGGDAGVDEEFGAVGEGEEGVGAGDAAGEFFGVAVFVGEFDGDFGGHGAGHLACAGGEELAVFADGDGVGFDVLGDEPDEVEVGPFFFGGLAHGRDGAVGAVEAGEVGLLDEHAAGDGAEVERVRREPTGASAPLSWPVARMRQSFQRSLSSVEASARIARGDDDFEEAFAGDDGVGGGFVDFAVEGDDAAEGGDRVAGVGEIEGLGERCGDGAAAGIGVLDDGGGGMCGIRGRVRWRRRRRGC